MICIPIVARTHAEALARLRACAGAGADLVELRLDHLEEQARLELLLGASPRPVVVTCRPRRVGGRWRGDEETRLALLARAAGLGAAYVDLEHDADISLRPGAGTRIIRSFHDFSSTPADLPRIVRELEAGACDVVKFATTATCLEDNLRVFAALRACRKPAVGLCMGAAGEISRVLALRQGALFTFGALEAGQESAPGQLTADDLADLYRVREITPATRVYGVAGDPIAHSMSPEIHNHAFRELGLDAVYLRLLADDFTALIERVAPALELRGLSVTIPHKQAALQVAGKVASLAADIGAVNTLTREDGEWVGENTDCAAAMDAIRGAANRAGRNLRGARALLLGAGGTARAVGFGLREAGVELTVANRTHARARSLAADLGARSLELEEAAAREWDLVANSTSVGMHPRVEADPLPGLNLRPGMVVFDAVYNPMETMILRRALAAGAQVATGLEMFVGQAARQFERWTGRPAPRELMRGIVARRLGAVPPAKPGKTALERQR